ETTYEMMGGPRESWKADACYSNGYIWLGSNERDSYNADARYDGDDEGAVAAAVLLLLLGAGSSSDSDSSEESDSEAESTDNEPSYPGSSVGTYSRPTSSSRDNWFGWVLGLVAMFVFFVWQRDQHPSTPLQNRSVQPQSPVVKVAPESSRFAGFWEQALHLRVPAEKPGELSLSERNELLLAGEAISEPLLYAGREAPKSASVVQPSETSRFAFVSLCSEYWCDDIRLVDMQLGLITSVQLTKSGTSGGVTWSPDDKYALVKWSHGGEVGLTCLNLESLKVTDTPSDFIRELFGYETGDIDGPPKGVDYSLPFPDLEMNDAKWKDSQQVEIQGWVFKIRWTGSVTTLEKSWRIAVLFSVPSLAVVSDKKIQGEEPEGSENPTASSDFESTLSPVLPVTPDVMDEDLSHVNGEHRPMVQGWLNAHSQWRLATVADCKCDTYLPAIQKYFYNEHPYYVVGDFNRDRQRDVAVMAVNKTSGSIELVVFTGPLHDGVMPFEFPLKGSIKNSLMFYDIDGGSIMVGEKVGGGGVILEQSSTGFGWRGGLFRICGSKTTGLLQIGCLDAPER
ncbi:MAG: hypothetical protein WC794_05335, partial [Candidatus Doudnabacteria bacterium]